MAIQTRESYIVGDPRLDYIFQRLSDRLDALEGIRPEFDEIPGLIKKTEDGFNSVEDNSDEWDDAYDHISSTGASHTYIDQDVTESASPIFASYEREGCISGKNVPPESRVVLLLVTLYNRVS